jgi:hypothetical protein
MTFSLLMFASFSQLILREQPGLWATAGLLLALAFIRVEGVCWVIVLLALAAFLRRRAGQRLLSRLALAGALALGGYALYFFWRWHYYGLVFANTTSVKAGFGFLVAVRGGRYVLWNYLTLLTPLLALPGFFCALSRRRRPAGLAAGFMAGAVAASSRSAADSRTASQSSFRRTS